MSSTDLTVALIDDMIEVLQRHRKRVTADQTAIEYAGARCVTSRRTDDIPFGDEDDFDPALDDQDAKMFRALMEKNLHQ